MCLGSVGFTLAWPEKTVCTNGKICREKMVGPAVLVSVFVAAGKRMGFGSFYWYILAIKRDLMLSVPYSRNLRHEADIGRKRSSQLETETYQ